MTDKLLEAAIAVVNGWSKQRFDSRSALMCQCIDALHRAAITAAQAEPKSEPDMRHPKIQALIGAKARREIEIRIAEDLLDDPKHEISGTEGDYWYSLHDKIVELQHRAQAEQSASATSVQEHVGWSDEFGNLFPLVTHKPKSATWRDGHKRTWRPVYASAPHTSARRRT